MSKLVGLLKRLGQDAGLEGEYEKDPDGVMDRFGLSDDEREALRSGDVDKISAMTGLENLKSTQSTVKSYDD
jgi:hypothetical protein